MSPDTIFIHADESCLGNQFQTRANPGGAAGLMEAWQEGEWQRRDYWISESDTTNNRMALRSAIEGLRVLNRRCTVHFISDSRYLVDGITQWLPSWKQNNWKRKRGTILKLELRKELDLSNQDFRNGSTGCARRACTWTTLNSRAQRRVLGKVEPSGYESATWEHPLHASQWLRKDLP